MKQPRHPEIGVCGLSCRLCPSYHRDTKSRCGGCKSEDRMAAGCPFITCAVKRKGIEFCWGCEENEDCDKWKQHREHGKQYDTFMCYQALERNISFIQSRGVEDWVETQKARESLLREMLRDYNQGRSKTHYCIAATVLEVEELREALTGAREGSEGLDPGQRSALLRRLLDEIALGKGYCLKLRKRANPDSA